MDREDLLLRALYDIANQLRHIAEALERLAPPLPTEEDHS